MYVFCDVSFEENASQAQYVSVRLTGIYYITWLMGKLFMTFF